MTDTPARYYEVHPALQNISLENSYVLQITQSPGVVEFKLDAALTPEHPRYRPPKADEWTCFEGARLCLRSLRGLELSRSNTPPASDATGETDLGSIDSMVSLILDGAVAWEWGTLKAVDPEVTFDLSP